MRMRMQLAESYLQGEAGPSSLLPKPGQQAAQAARMASEAMARCVHGCATYLQVNIMDWLWCTRGLSHRSAGLAHAAVVNYSAAKSQRPVPVGVNLHPAILAVDSLSF